MQTVERAGKGLAACAGHHHGSDRGGVPTKLGRTEKGRGPGPGLTMKREGRQASTTTARPELGVTESRGANATPGATAGAEGFC